jgi:hypothetical protein
MTSVHAMVEFKAVRDDCITMHASYRGRTPRIQRDHHRHAPPPSLRWYGRGGHSRAALRKYSGDALLVAARIYLCNGLQCPSHSAS